MTVMILLLLSISVLFPVAVILAYRQGITDGRAIKQETPLSPVLPKTPIKVAARSIDDENAAISFTNMINYDGTLESQTQLIKEGR